METGKDLDTIINDKIKTNNRQWFALICLFIIILGGYATMITSRNIDLKKELFIANDSINYQATIIDIQYKTLDTAVYFKDLK